MQVLRYSLGELQACCYFLIQNSSCIIMDPADEAAFILEELQRRKLRLVGMIATHGHFDHIGAVGEIQVSLVGNRYTCPLYINKDDQFLIERLNETAKHFLAHDPRFLKPREVKNLAERTYAIKNFTFQVISTPGHTPGSCCFYFKEEKIIFTGDTLFKSGIGRCDFSYSDKKELKKSLRRILTLPSDTTVYPGHGEATTVQEEARSIL